LRNRAISILRLRGRHGSLTRRDGTEIDVEDRRQLDPPARLAAAELQQLVEDALAKASPRDRVILRLSCDEQRLTYKQIGEQLGVKASTVGSIVFRFRRALE